MLVCLLMSFLEWKSSVQTCVVHKHLRHCRPHVFDSVSANGSSGFYSGRALNLVVIDVLRLGKSLSVQIPCVGLWNMVGVRLLSATLVILLSNKVAVDRLELLDLC